MAKECNMIRGSTIKPHYPVQIQVNQRPRLTKVFGPVGAWKWPEAEPVHPNPSWEEATKKLIEVGWKVPRFSTMNTMQDLYLNKLGIRNESIELANMDCTWSATLTM